MHIKSEEHKVMVIGKMVKEERKKKVSSQQGLADKLKVSLQTVSKRGVKAFTKI